MTELVLFDGFVSLDGVVSLDGIGFGGGRLCVRLAVFHRDRHRSDGRGSVCRLTICFSSGRR